MRSIRWTWLLLAAGAFLACGGQGGNVSVSVKTPATAATAAGGADLGNGISLTEVRMVVRRIDLFTAMPAPEKAPSRGDLEADHGEDHDELPGATFGPFPVDVAGDALKGGIHPVFDAKVDKGKFTGARIVVNTLPGTFPPDPVLTAMQALHASIAIDGTIDGKAFQFVTPMRVAQSKAGPIEIGDGTKNLTLDVDPRGWFKNETGGRLDPTAQNDRGEILENLRCSIRLFEDDDRDGEPDDGDHGEVEGCPPAPVTPPATPPATPPTTPM